MNNDLNTMSEWAKIAKIWQTQLNLEYLNPTKNVRLSFKDIGPFAEFMAINYLNGYVGSGSGGMGFDLMNYETHKAIEVKSCCTIQNAVCNDCGTKFNNLFLNQCPKCKSTEYKEISDSRFSINAKEFLDQYENGFFEKFYLCYVSLINYDDITTKMQIGIEWFFVSFEDNSYKDIQLEYFKNQVNFGRKNNCNLLPYSFDFYKLVPQKISDITIEFIVKDLNSNPIISEKPNTKLLKISIDKMHNNKERKLFKQLKTYDKKTETADIIDFTLNIPYAKKTLGKERGNTRTKVYDAIK